MLRVHSYESMGTFDGPGLRLVVFLQGCNFRCLYCANPDTIEACGGTPTEAAEILRMARDQKPFFGRRGGVTFSGGEPTFQAAELIPLVRALRAEGIHVCLDSNGGVWNPAVEELLELADLVLLDVKQAAPERHRALTGRDNAPTLRTAAWLEEHDRPFWLRHVPVPGYSDAEEDIRALGERLGGYRMIERVELLPYHTLGVHKYEAMGLEYPLRDVREKHPPSSSTAPRPCSGVLPDGGGELIPKKGGNAKRPFGRRNTEPRRSRPPSPFGKAPHRGSPRTGSGPGRARPGNATEHPRKARRDSQRKTGFRKNRSGNPAFPTINPEPAALT